MAGVIVQEWLAEHGGSENVTESISRVFPDAPIYTLWNDNPERFPPERVHESWLAKTPLRKSKSLALPLMPQTWRHLGESDADWILASSHLFAHHARFSGAAARAPKFVYVHTPARYIWNPELDERGNSPVVRAASRALKPLDRRRAQEAHSIAANSEFVRARVRDAWGRDAKVIYPPVDVSEFIDPDSTRPLEAEIERLEDLPDQFLLGASRLIPYKRLDLVIRAGHAARLPVVIAGAGPVEPELRELAVTLGAEVSFFGRPSRGALRQLYSRATAYLFPAVEDFGIMPVEAMACGTPVVALNVGGAAETVIDGVSGVLVRDYSPHVVAEAVRAASTLSGIDCVNCAMRFDSTVFQSRISEWLGSE